MKPDDENIGPVRMIAGMSRAGTVWLCRSLNAHSEVAAFGESSFFGRRFVAPKADGSYSDAQLSKVLYQIKRRRLGSTLGEGPGCLQMSHSQQAAMISDAFDGVTKQLGPGEVFRRMCYAVAHANGKTIPIEKTPQHIIWINRILRYVPDVRMVVMLRDPYSFMLSYKHQGDRKPVHVRQNFATLYHPLVCAFLWRSYVRAALSAQATHPGQILLVRNEELERPFDLLQRVQRFFKLTPESLPGVASGMNSSFPDGKRPELSPADVFWMNAIACRDIEQYGCEPRFTPRAAWVSAVGSLLKLPMWSLRNAVRMRRLVGGNVCVYLAKWLRCGLTQPSERSQAVGESVEA